MHCVKNLQFQKVIGTKFNDYLIHTILVPLHRKIIELWFTSRRYKNYFVSWDWSSIDCSQCSKHMIKRFFKTKANMSIYNLGTAYPFASYGK